MARKILTAIGTLTVLGGSLIVAELWVAARYADSPAILGTPKVHLSNVLTQNDPVLGTHFRPNSESFFASPYGEFSVNYQINEIGLRDSGMISAGDRPPLVIFLGEAFVEGRGLMPEVTFIRVLQRTLRVLDDISIFTRLLNAGMPGYGAAQSYLLGQRLLNNIGADAIVFVYSSLMPTVDHDYLARVQLNEDGIAMGLMSGESLNRANDTDAPHTWNERRCTNCYERSLTIEIV